MTFKLVVRCVPPAQIDLTGICLSNFLGKAAEEIARAKLPQGMGELGDWFDVTGNSNDARWVFEGTGGWLDGVASGLRVGTVMVEGSVGDLAGTGMRGGELHIVGDAGSFVGGPRRGERTGMRGGLITIVGSAGKGAGHRMRRGTLFVFGGVDELCGWEMVAGTIVIGSEIGPSLGFAMRRGTIVSLKAQAADGIQKTMDGAFRFSTWLPLVGSYPALLGTGLIRLLKRRTLGPLDQTLVAPLTSLVEEPVEWKRAVGDRNAGGVGEVLAHMVR